MESHNRYSFEICFFHSMLCLWGLSVHNCSAFIFVEWAYQGFIYSFYYWWLFGLLPELGRGAQCCTVPLYIGFLVHTRESLPRLCIQKWAAELQGVWLHWPIQGYFPKWFPTYAPSSSGWELLLLHHLAANTYIAQLLVFSSLIILKYCYLCNYYIKEYEHLFICLWFLFIFFLVQLL